MWKRSLFSLFSAGLLVLSFPAFDIYPLAWVAFLPLFWSIKGISAFSAFQQGFGAGMVFFLGLLYWLLHAMTVYGHLSFLFSICLLMLLIIYLAFYLGVFCYLIVRLELFECVFFPWLTGMLWVALEYLRGHLLTGFPWEHLGDSQYRWLSFIQGADIGGVYLLSFLIMTANACLFLCLEKKNKTAFFNAAFFLGLFLALLSYGHYKLRFWETKIKHLPHLKIALIQGNIDESKKWDPAFQTATLKTYAELSLKAAAQKPDLLVWPETALPFYFQQPSPFREFVLNLVKQINVPLLTGSPAYEITSQKVKYFNRAYFINKKGRVVDYYDKVHLVPFGEYVPCRCLLKFLPAIAAQQGDFFPGNCLKPLILKKKIPFGVLICFEGIFSEISRQLVQKEASFLVNITNDAWFGRTSAPYQHFSMLVLRAVENRRGIARCANTGFSAFILPTGKITQRSELFKPEVLIGTLPLVEEKTFYMLHGDILAYLCLCGIFINILLKRRGRWKKSKSV
jgi:apolipoprotein N-acyltransferase